MAADGGPGTRGGLGQSVSAPLLPGLRKNDGPDPEWVAAEAGSQQAMWPGSVDHTGGAASGKRPVSRLSSLTSQEGSPRPGSSVSKSASAAQLRKGLAKLPPLPRVPLTFEELYALAKKRAIQKTAENRKLAPPRKLPPPSPKLRLGSNKMLSAAGDSRPSTSGEVKCSLSSEQQAEEDAWISSALQASVKQADKDHQPPARPVLTREVTFQCKDKAESEFQDPASESQQQAPQTASEKLSGQMKESSSSQPGQTKLHRGSSMRLTREKSYRASVKYIHAIRKAIAGERSDSVVDIVEADFGGGENLGLQDHSTAMTRHAAEGFSEEELTRMRVAFRRFKTAEGSEIHIDDLKEALHHLGYMKSDREEVIKDMVGSISRFSTIDWQEFVDFVEKFASWEREQCRVEFDRFDTDQSGTLDMDEIKTLLSEMGITPLKATLEEGRTVVDYDSSGEFDFDEFLHLMAVYRVTEGFTRAEVKTLRQIFDRVAIIPLRGKDKEVRPEQLKDALAHWFGPQAAEMADRLRKKLEHYTAEADAEANKSQSPPPTAGAAQGGWDEWHGATETVKPTGLQFQEFLVWARRLREAEIEEYRVQFKRFSKHNVMGEEEIVNVIHALGYMPLRKMVQEVLDTCDVDENGVVDFDEFVNLMAMYRSTDGFSKDEVQELGIAFDSFKTPDEDQVSCLELLDVLRSLGHVTSLDVVRRYIKEVDFDNSNSLDMREFLRLMRLHREEELKQVQKIYMLHKDKDLDVMKQKSVMGALKQLGYSPEDDVVEQEMIELENPAEIDFDNFVVIVDQSRKACMVTRRKKAGFSDQEIKKYEQAFAVYDEDGNGDIEKDELTKLLTDLDIPMRTVDDQKGMLSKLDEAREAARKAGVEDELIGNMGDPAITFHTLLHLVRLLNSADDRAEVDRDTKVMQELNFAPREVAEFREIFEHWAKQPGVAKSDGTTLVDGQVVQKRGGAISKAETAAVTFLSAEGVRRVVRSLGLQLTPEQKAELDQKVKEGSDDKGQTGFTEFLTLMRWMLDTNFGGVNDAVAAAA